MAEDEAKHKANRKLGKEELDKFMLKYENLMQYLMQVRAGRIHSKVTKLTHELVEDGMDYRRAIKIAIRKYRQFFENFLDEVIEEEEIDLYKERKYRFFISSFYSVNQTRWLCWKNICRRYTCITILLMPQVSPDLKNYIHLLNGTESTNSVNTKLESGFRTKSSIPCKD